MSKTTVSAVNAEGEARTPVEVGALGHTLCLDITVEGVQVEALVDSCSEVTIISRSFFARDREMLQGKREIFTSVSGTITGFVWQE